MHPLLQPWRSGTPPQGAALTSWRSGAEVRIGENRPNQMLGLRGTGAVSSRMPDHDLWRESLAGSVRLCVGNVRLLPTGRRRSPPLSAGSEHRACGLFSGVRG